MVNPPGAYEAEIAKEAVPNNEPVNEVATTLFVTLSEFNEASDPDTISFFQFGIYVLLLRLETATLLPTSLTGQH
jgi:hypothetical protein